MTRLSKIFGVVASSLFAASAMAAISESTSHDSSWKDDLKLHVRPPTVDVKAPVSEYSANHQNLMNILVNSVYSDNEVFLRELISNASDANLKYMQAKFDAMDEAVVGETPFIRIYMDKDEGVLTVEDSGVGMTEQEMHEFLGTIGNSGTKILEELKRGDTDSKFIGKFGIGFYACFLVAEEATVVSRSMTGAPQVVWRSLEGQTYSVSEDPTDTPMPHGTRIHLKLRDEFRKYLEADELKTLIVKYSRFIMYPIQLLVEQDHTEEVPMTAEEIEEAQRLLEQKNAERAAKKAEKDAKVAELIGKKREERELKRKSREEAIEARRAAGEENPEDITDSADDLSDEDMSLSDNEDDEQSGEAKKEDEAAPTTKKVTKKVHTFEEVNTTKPIWSQNRKEVSEEDYNQFYKTTFKKTENPLSHLHYSAEGPTMNYRAVLFLEASPESNPLEIQSVMEHKHIHLYIRNVLVGYANFEFLSNYHGVVYGVVESNDLSLTLSREMMQRTRPYQQIGEHLHGKVISMFSTCANDDDETKARTFQRIYGTHLRLGVLKDTAYSKNLTALLRFHSSTHEFTSLSEYVQRMPADAKEILYVSAQTVEEAKNIPQLEGVAARGGEVLFFVNPMDEYVVQSVNSFEEKEFRNLCKATYKEMMSDSDADKVSTETREQMKPLTDFLTKVLRASVERVVISNKLVNSVCSVSASEFALSPRIERAVRAQQGQPGGMKDEMVNFYLKMKKIFDINPKSPVILSMLDELKRATDTADDKATRRLTLMARLLYQGALISSGYELVDPKEHTKTIHQMIKLDLGNEDAAEIAEDAKTTAADDIPNMPSFGDMKFDTSDFDTSKIDDLLKKSREHLDASKAGLGGLDGNGDDDYSWDKFSKDGDGNDNNEDENDDHLGL